MAVVFDNRLHGLHGFFKHFDKNNKMICEICAICCQKECYFLITGKTIIEPFLPP